MRADWERDQAETLFEVFTRRRERVTASRYRRRPAHSVRGLDGDCDPEVTTEIKSTPDALKGAVCKIWT